MLKICYVSGTRADFGLMSQTLRLLHRHPQIDLSVCVTAMHLLPEYGYTVSDIEKESFRICARIKVSELLSTTGESMAKAIGTQIHALTDVFLKEKPDVVLLLGDRGEMLAAAIAAVHLNIHIAHVHGGDRSGTVDEMVRHAISKLSHYHFVTTAKAKDRLIKMGERTQHIIVSGAPGLDELPDIQYIPKDKLFTDFNFSTHKKTALLIFHPVVQEQQSIRYQFHQVIAGLLAMQYQILCLTPNADAGGNFIRAAMNDYIHSNELKVEHHLPRTAYLSWLNAVDVMVGNSSSGIIEAASFNLPVLNVGSRQNLRERGDNVIDVAADKKIIMDALMRIEKDTPKEYINIYGEGKACQVILQSLLQFEYEIDVLNKCNTY